MPFLLFQLIGPVFSQKKRLKSKMLTKRRMLKDIDRRKVMTLVHITI